MKYIISFLLVICCNSQVYGKEETDVVLITQAVKNYIIAQHETNETPMDKALHEKLAKRTFWKNSQGSEFIMETSRQTMLKVAKNYNENGTQFPKSPRIDIEVFDIDQRVASVKLTADDWIDYMHLIKTEKGQWKILNVLWQYHNVNKHISK